MPAKDSRFIQKVIEILSTSPGLNIEQLASKIGFPERDIKYILQELKRQNIINSDYENITLLRQANIEEIFKSLKTFEPRTRPIVIDEIARQIDIFRRETERYRQSIQSKFCENCSYEDLIKEYLEKTDAWIQELENKRTASAEKDKTILEHDRDFIKQAIRVILPSKKTIDLDVDEDFKEGGVASFNDIKSLSLSKDLFPITVSLAIAQKVAIIRAKNGDTIAIFDPDTSGAVSSEDIEDIDNYHVSLSFNDKIRVRYSKNKIYLYDLIGKVMREFSTTVLFLGESVLPPDMWYRDFEKGYRKKIHMDCMNRAVNIAQSSKIFGCPVAQVTRSNSSRRRETSILTRLAFGLVVETPQEYTKLTERGNFDDVLFSIISKDKEISPSFVINEKFAYLKDSTVEDKALVSFGEGAEGKREFGAYKSMLDALQTTIVFLNYNGAGLRFRFFSYPLNDTEILNFSLRLANYGYIDAVKTENNIAFLNSIERAKESAEGKANEIFGTILNTLKLQTGGT